MKGRVKDLHHLSSAFPASKQLISLTCSQTSVQVRIFCAWSLCSFHTDCAVSLDQRQGHRRITGIRRDLRFHVLTLQMRKWEADRRRDLTEFYMWAQNQGEGCLVSCSLPHGCLEGRGHILSKGHTFWLLGNVETHGHLLRSRLSVHEVEELTRESVTPLSRGDT